MRSLPWLFAVAFAAACTGGAQTPPSDGSDAGAGAGAGDDLGDNLSEPGPDLAGTHPIGGSPDLAMLGGMLPVQPNGGTVDLLHFGVTGDTRPGSCEDTAGYPTMIINAIADAYSAHGAQFAVDLGDHMYVCNNDLNVAKAQMGLYMNAVRRFGKTWFMTMGNHECWKGPCLAGSQNANYVAYMNALAPIAKLPYYSVDIQTSKGLATFVFIADNAWDNTQAAWLERTLALADQKASYTIPIRHHPEGDTTVPTNADSVAIIRRHKFALFLTGHDHRYAHMTTDNHRDVVVGMGGAPLLAQGTFWGYMMVDQQRDGTLQMTVYDVNGGAMMDHFSVGPN